MERRKRPNPMAGGGLSVFSASATIFTTHFGPMPGGVESLMPTASLDTTPYGRVKEDFEDLCLRLAKKPTYSRILPRHFCSFSL